ncbi:MAG: c-type cytochrome [Alphaproteobacteria bacterium]
MIRRIALLLSVAGPVLAGSFTAAAEDQAADSSRYGDVEHFEEGDAATGAKLYKRYCRGCHGEDGRGGAHTFMPHIQNLTKKGYIELLPDSYLYTAIADGGEAVGKSAYMPAWKSKLTDREVKDLIAHIRAMPTY